VSTRLEALKSLVEQDPKNFLARYGLAMEYASGGLLEEAVGEFQVLMAVNPDYAYAYFHSGQTLERLGRTEEARAMYKRGIESAQRIGDEHARSELTGALERLG
jgi:tetratricopeptide (TPR) repeat protein